MTFLSSWKSNQWSKKKENVHNFTASPPSNLSKSSLDCKCPQKEGKCVVLRDDEAHRNYHPGDSYWFSWFSAIQLSRITFLVYNVLVATEPLGYGSPSIRDVLPLELFTCLWLVSPQAPAVERLFSLPSAMVQQFDFIKHFLISTPFSNWCSLCCARSNFCLVQDTKIVTQRPNSRTLGFLFSSSWWISLLVKKSNFLLVSENSRNRGSILSYMTGAYYHIYVNAVQDK